MEGEQKQAAFSFKISTQEFITFFNLYEFVSILFVHFSTISFRDSYVRFGGVVRGGASVFLSNSRMLFCTIHNMNSYKLAISYNSYEFL